MNADLYAQVKEVVAGALDRPMAERDSYVAQKCAGDGALRREVDSLLAESDDVESLPRVRAAVVAAAAAAALSARVPDPAATDKALIEILETALGTQYEIIRPLGRGGMGAVYLARERALDRFVAIKVLRPDLATADEGRERFRREARVVAHLSHPNILPLHTFGEVHGVWYFVMGFVRGMSLDSQLHAEKRLPGAEVHRILSELADAAECAHRHGVIHRDIKPANILLDEESGRAMLADFGISKVAGGDDDSLTEPGARIGTLHFMSPEQLLGTGTVDERSDIYSIGAVGYTMLTGREPFAGMTAAQLAARRMSIDPPSIDSIVPGAPKELAALIMRCLARDPADRWRGARALRRALRRASEDGSATLSEGMRDLPAFGPYAVLWAGGWTVVALSAMRDARDRALLMLIAFLVPLGFVLHVWIVGRHEGGTKRVARVAFWPPEWWGMWWPRKLRRPVDLWSRLPLPARAVRSVLSAFIVALPLLILLRAEFERAVGSFASQAAPIWFVRVELLLVGGTALVTAAALWWTHRLRLSRADAVRVLFGATTPSPGWNAPSLMRLLRPVNQAATRAPQPDSPADHRRAVRDIARTLSLSSETRDRLDQLGDSLLQAIDQCDAEISSLSRDASAGELDRLTSHVAAHERESSPTRERRELGDLRRQQLEVVRRMRIRCELMGQRRTMLFSLLRGLWTKINELGDEAEDLPPIALDERAIEHVQHVERSFVAPAG